MPSPAEELASAVEAALPGWVVRCVTRLAPGAGERAAAEAAGQRAGVEVGAAVRALLLTDVDAQRTTPLALLRDAVRYPTAVLAEAGVPPVARDPFAVERFPDDVYDLTPASFADVEPGLGELGIRWGASKAWEHKQRHGAGS